MAEVRLENVVKVYPGNVTAVKNVSLTIRDKELLVLVGPSGCGKTTILRMIAGLEEISQGTIQIGGRVVNDVPPKDRDIAMVFQNYALYPHMTVYNNMAFGLKLRKFPKAEIDNRVKEAARILGIMELLDRKPKALSGGQRQRVAVGRAIVRKPAVFLFDEPLSNLDAKLRVDMRAEIKKLHARLQTTMIYVTHDQVEAMTLGDRIVVLKDGVIQQADAPLAVYERPNNLFVAGFVGTPPMNFLKGKFEAANGSMVFSDGANRIRLPAALTPALKKRPGPDLLIGVRPEDMRPMRAGDAGPVEPESALKGTISVIEPLGNEILLYVSVKNQELVAKASPRFKGQVNDPVQVALDLGKLHPFDVETGERLEA